MIDWNSAPEWAVGHGYTPAKQSAVWIGHDKYQYCGGDNNVYCYGQCMTYSRHELINVTMRPQEWPTDEQRIDVIGTNGPSGEHYGMLSTATKRAIQLAHEIVKQLSEMSAAELAWIASTDEAKRLVELLGERPAATMDNTEQLYPKSHGFVEQRVTANKYDRTIHGKYGTGSVTVDVYRVLNAFGPLSPEIDHAVKKLLAAGTRGAKSERQDLLEAIQSIEARLQYLEARDGDVK